LFEKKPIGRASYARIEYLAVRSLVEEKRAEGYSIKLIYEELFGAGRVTMGYTSFCDYLRGKGERQHGAKKTDQKQGKASSPAPGKTKNSSAPATSKMFAPAAKDEPFKIERYTLEELVYGENRERRS